MPDWSQILNEVNIAGSQYHIIRQRYLKDLQNKTGRNVIVYYSGWLQEPDAPGVDINDEDKKRIDDSYTWS